MMDVYIIMVILLMTVLFFLWGRWRHDMVALGALLACVATDMVPAATAFSGFGHPAVITVASVLILSRALQTSGAVDALARVALPHTSSPTLNIAAITTLAALLSAFMNNVGALALLLPVAVQIAGRQNIPPGRVLMPLAFGSILGGMTTLIGTPPNLIVSAFRAKAGEGTFAMFDFTPVGSAVAAAGILFVTFLGWRLVPTRERTGVESFETGAYLTEARVPEKAKAAGMTARQIEDALEDADAQLIGVIRHEVRLPALSSARKIYADDILIIEAEPEALSAALSRLGLVLEEAVQDKERKPSEEKTEKAASTEDIVLMELVVQPGSPLANRSASDIRLRTRFGLNLLAISRQGRRSLARLRTMNIQVGDVLLMQGPSDSIMEFSSDFVCVPLAPRPMRLPDKRQAIIAATIMLLACGGAALGLVPAAVSFAAGVLAVMALRVMPLREVYEAVDWPVIVLLAALLPVAGALASTGAAELIAQSMLRNLATGNAVIALVVILVVTMTLSDFMNNAATAAVMCPIAIGSASQLGVNADPFLMAVAVGASCAFLTPIGHQNNTLILGPGGFHFGDYWRLGLPLEIIVIAIGVPMILMVWPL